MPGSTMKKVSIALATGLVFFSSVTAFAGEPTDFIKQRTAEVTKIFEKKSSKSRAKKLDAKLQETVDFEELASRAFGEKHWDVRSAEEKQEFLSLLQRMLKANYASKLEGKTLEEDFKIVYDKERTRKDMAFVETTVVVEDDQRPVAYKLLKRDGGWIVYDLIIDDISLEETYREDYVAIIEAGETEAAGWKDLIGRMNDRIEQLEAEAKK